MYWIYSKRTTRLFMFFSLSFRILYLVLNLKLWIIAIARINLCVSILDMISRILCTFLFCLFVFSFRCFQEHCHRKSFFSVSSTQFRYPKIRLNKQFSDAFPFFSPKVQRTPFRMVAHILLPWHRIISMIHHYFVQQHRSL